MSLPICCNIVSFMPKYRSLICQIQWIKLTGKIKSTKQTDLIINLGVKTMCRYQSLCTDILSGPVCSILYQTKDKLQLLWPLQVAFFFLFQTMAKWKHIMELLKLGTNVKILECRHRMVPIWSAQALNIKAVGLLCLSPLWFQVLCTRVIYRQTDWLHKKDSVLTMWYLCFWHYIFHDWFTEKWSGDVNLWFCFLS